MKAACTLLVAAAALSFGQATKKAAPPSARPSTWQKSKECASQAEKVVEEWPNRTGATPTDWNNHYSPKYDKCFVSLHFSQPSKDEKTYPTLFSTALFDAFERSPPLASSCTVLAHADCAEQIVRTARDVMLESVSQRLYGKSFGEASADEQEAARTAADRILNDVPTKTALYCGIDGRAVDCEKAASFISEHMKN